MKIVLGIITCGLLACVPTTPSTELSQVQLSLDTARCTDYCIDTVQATLYRPSSPFSPASTPIITSCEGAKTITFEFNAGTTLFSEVQMSSQGSLVLEGQSEEATVATDQVTNLIVELSPSPGSGIVVESVAPDPVVEGGEITLYGAEFPDQDGWWAVQLDTSELEASGVQWGTDSITATLAPGQGGISLELRNCGLLSNQVPIRIAKTELGYLDYVFSACNELLTIESYLEDGREKILALCSDSASGNLTLFDFDTCGVGQTVASFSANEFPTPVRHFSLLDAGESAWMAFEGGAIKKIDLSNDLSTLLSVDLPEETEVIDLVGRDDTCYVLTRDADEQWKLWEIIEVAEGQATVEDASSGLGLDALESPRAILYSGDSLFLATYDQAVNHGKFRQVGDNSNSLVALDTCPEPTAIALAESRNWVAVTCKDTTTSVAVVMDLSESETKLGDWSLDPAQGVPTVVVFDVDEDVIFVAAEDDAFHQTVIALKIETEEAGLLISHVQSWSVPSPKEFAFFKRATNSNRFVGPGGANVLRFFNPYLGQVECMLGGGGL